MANGIVENLDFFDSEVYSEDIDDLDQTKQEEGDPSEFEKKKDVYNIYENAHKNIVNSWEFPWTYSTRINKLITAHLTFDITF